MPQLHGRAAGGPMVGRRRPRCMPNKRMVARRDTNRFVVGPPTAGVNAPLSRHAVRKGRACLISEGRLVREAKIRGAQCLGFADAQVRRLASGRHRIIPTDGRSCGRPANAVFATVRRPIVKNPSSAR